MAVVIETTVGDFTVDLFTEKRPQTCLNFLKLCKIKYYNWSLFHSVQSNFIAQTGDPLGTGKGGESVYGMVLGEKARYYEAEQMPKMKHDRTGLLSMVNCGNNMLGSQFFITLGSELQSLDGHHCVFGEITEGLEIVLKLNEAICDGDSRPYQDIRISHTIILEDPYDDPKGLIIPDRSPEPTKEALTSDRIGADEAIDDTAGMTSEEIAEMQKDREAKARATILEIVGDLPDAEMAPPENVLFVCKLNPVTGDDDLEIIFSRFGKIIGCEVIRDRQTGDSLQYAFIEFAERKSCEEAYFKMDNVLIDDRRIHVDFSQSVAKMRWRGKGKGIQYFDEGQKDKAMNGNPRNAKDRSQRNDDRRDKVKKEIKDTKESKDKDRHCSLKEDSDRRKKDDHKKEKPKNDSERRSRDERRRSFDGRKDSHVRSGDRRDERRHDSFDNRRDERDRRRVDTEWTFKRMEYRRFEEKRERHIERWEEDNKRKVESDRRRREEYERLERHRSDDLRHKNGREFKDRSYDKRRGGDDYRSKDKRRDDDHHLKHRGRESSDRIIEKKSKFHENDPKLEKRGVKADVKADSTSSDVSSSSESDSTDEEKNDKSKKKLKKRRHSTSSSDSLSESDEPKSKIRKKKKHKDVGDSEDSDGKKKYKKQVERVGKKKQKCKRRSTDSEDMKKSTKSMKQPVGKKTKGSKTKKIKKKSSSSETESSDSSSDSDSSNSDSSESDSRKQKKKEKSKKSNKHKKSRKSRKRNDTSSSASD